MSNYKVYLNYLILFFLVINGLFMSCNLEMNDSTKQNPYIEYKSITLTDGNFLEFALVTPEVFDPAGGNPVLLAFPPGDHTQSEVQWALDSYWIRQSIQRNWIVVSPMAVNGLNYYEGPEKYIPELLDWVENNYSVENNKYHLSGISNGGKSAFRIAIKFRKRVSSLMVLPGKIHSIDEYALLDSLIGIPVHMYVGEYEIPEWTNVMDSIKIILDDLGVTNQYITFPGEGHTITSLTSTILFDTLDSFRTYSQD